MPNMNATTFDQMDQHLGDWVKGVLDGVEVFFTFPDPADPNQGVCLYLFELTPKPAPRSNAPQPLQVSLRYLVTVWADQPEEAHRQLGELVFAAMSNPEFETDLEPLPLVVWPAFGVLPRPAFILTVSLRHERPMPPVKLVRKPLVLKSAPITTLRGVVLGPDDVPLPNARVEIPNLQLFEVTDTRGRFTFPSVPGEPRAKLLRIQARGRALETTIEQPASDEPVVIHFDLFD